MNGHSAEHTGISFGIFTDLHAEIMHDAKSRLDTFYKDMEASAVDFIIHCGDFCYPSPTRISKCDPKRMPVNLFNSTQRPASLQYLELVEQYNNQNIPTYHVLGNHEMDFASKEEVMALYRMQRNYYSFKVKDWKFMVLDGDFYRNSRGDIVPYDHGDYFGFTDYPYIDAEQLQWLESELQDNDKTIIFSHQPIIGRNRFFKNQKEILRILKMHGNSVKLCISGHLHIDDHSEWEGIQFVTLNSMSNYWSGTEHAKNRLSQEIDKEYPNIKYTFPYEIPLYSIITINPCYIHIAGKKGRFFPPDPTRNQMPSDFVITPNISEMTIAL